MNMIKHNDSIYVINDVINIHGTYHLIISRDNDVQFINRVGDKYLIPKTDLSIEKNSTKTLEYIRKQHLLNLLIAYIKDNSMYNSINKITEIFKEYVKTSLVETFLFWPYMTDSEFSNELNIIKKDLEEFLNKKLNNRLLASDNETIIINDYYDLYSNLDLEDEFIPDPSYRQK